jgi:cytochrome c peroxidase
MTEKKPTDRLGRRRRRGLVLGTSLMGVVVLHSGALAQTYEGATSPDAPPAPKPASAPTPAVAADTPDYFKKIYRHMLNSPLPKKIYDQGGIPAVVPQLEIDSNPAGKLGSYQPAGETITANNAFFQSLGTNGRSCVTCHQPPSGMSISAKNVQRRFDATNGTDPIFAPVDGANCPNQVPAANTSGAPYGGRKGYGKNLRKAYSLLLNKGLIRIALPLPASADFTLEVVSDPTTCNTTPEYNSVTDPVTGATTRIVSVFRRPLISTNLDFKTATIFPGPNPAGGNLMWDGREPSLESQAVNATLGHAQALVPPTAEQVAQIVAFERGIFAAQQIDDNAWDLTSGGALGGPINLSAIQPGQLSFEPFEMFGAWLNTTGSKAETRKTIARGEAIFNTRQFIVSNVSGFNDVFGGAPVPGTCSTCHNVLGAGSDAIPSSQRDIGIGGASTVFNGPAPTTDLPVFKLTCNPGTTLFNPEVVLTNDPAKALITGKCRDIGAKTVPSLRALASHAPFFSDGSAKTLLDVVNVYNARFSIGLTDQEKADLVNFLEAL